MMRKIQSEHALWMYANFGEVHSWRPLLGIVEEVGELAHAELKQWDGIRGRQDGIEDAVGDIALFLMGYCTTKGLDFEECVEWTWKKVRQRDWTKYPKDGISE